MGFQLKTWGFQRKIGGFQRKTGGFQRKTFDCFDLGREKGRQFYEKVYGVKIVIQNIKEQNINKI